ncbi:hypothetical protein [Pseudomonas sp.]|uniref:hypothetical protein n=1 Tax=Pseudomonas sp. TaxID=306 RepID=UPI001B1636B8|nr:hypothetical protein [Pseudomonas sp.]MBO9552230.1 hypothetical protein [Pseudomonas sp.]
MIKKDGIDYFNSILDAVKGVAMLVFGAVALLYFVFPSFEVVVRDRVLGESSCFYFGVWNGKSIRDSLFQLHAADFDPKTGLIYQDRTIYALGEFVGREECGTDSRRIEYSGKGGDCLQVLGSTYGGKIDSGETSIWVRALPGSCNHAN